MSFYRGRCVDTAKNTTEPKILRFVLVKVEAALPLISPAYDNAPADEQSIRKHWISYFAKLNESAPVDDRDRNAEDLAYAKLFYRNGEIARCSRSSPAADCWRVTGKQEVILTSCLSTTRKSSQSLIRRLLTFSRCNFET